MTSKNVVSDLSYRPPAGRTVIARGVACLLLATAAAAAQAQTGDDFSDRVDALYADYATPATPGCAVGVIHDGNYVHARGYGMANLEHGIAIDRNSVFRTGSVSKQFTATAIAILAERGELDLDADVHEYLPDLPDYEHEVTVRQMVHHTSGMGEYEGKTVYELSPGKAFRFGNEDYWTIAEFFDQVKIQPLIQPPDESFEYSNIAYFLLGQVVESVSGKTLRAFAADEMFGPLGMQASFFNDNVDGIVPNRADGYRPLEDGGFEIYMTNLDWVGDGGVFTTLNDFLLWDRAFMDGAVPGGAAVQSLVETPDPTSIRTMRDSWLDDGAGYAFGLEVGSWDGRRVLTHGGSWVGFRALYTRLPDDDLSIVVLCNRADALDDNRGRQLLEMSLEKFSP